MKHRSYVFTFNNYPAEFSCDDALDSWLQRLASKYAIAGREIGVSGTPHLQGYVQFSNPRSFTSVRKLLTGCHVEPAKGTAQQSRKYCSKDGSFRELGSCPEDPGNREIKRWEDARSLAKEGKFDEIPADIYVRYIGNLQRIFRDTLPPLESLTDVCGLWLMGSTGVGKSRGARLKFPGLYPKPLNKWWDGYRDHETVLLDDVDHGQSAWIGNFLKIWGDHYPFIAEKKGGSQLIRPKRIIVTSQYPISLLFTDPELSAALERRYRFVPVQLDKDIVWPET